MDDIIVKKLSRDDKIPYDLLLLADPSIEIINDYIHRGHCYAVYINDAIIGAYVMIKTRPLIFERVNIAVDEKHQSKGVGKRQVSSAIDIAKKKMRVF